MITGLGRMIFALSKMNWFAWSLALLTLAHKVINGNTRALGRAQGTPVHVLACSADPLQTNAALETAFGESMVHRVSPGSTPTGEAKLAKVLRTKETAITRVLLCPAKGFLVALWPTPHACMPCAQASAHAEGAATFRTARRACDGAPLPPFIDLLLTCARITPHCNGRPFAPGFKWHAVRRLLATGAFADDDVGDRAAF